MIFWSSTKYRNVGVLYAFKMSLVVIGFDDNLNSIFTMGIYNSEVTVRFFKLLKSIYMASVIFSLLLHS